jgi:Thioredoxin-like
MIPHERSLVQKLADKPFALIGVNSDKDREKLKQQLAKEEMTWRHFYDHSISGPIATAWNIHGWPTTYILDQHGVIRFRDLRDEDAEKAILALLEEMAAADRKDAQAPRKTEK